MGSLEVDCPDAPSVVARIRSLGRSHVVVFTGFSAAGYEDPAQVNAILLGELEQLDPAETLVCAGATVEGIGMVYDLAQRVGFRTAGIVSSKARAEGVPFSDACEVSFVVDDATWGGRQGDGRLSPTSLAMVGACDLMIGVGGGTIARDELETTGAIGKPVRFHRAPMRHALAIRKAREAGAAPPTDFGGEAQSLFTD